METKLLNFNLDKSCYLVVGEETEQKKIRKELKETPLTLSGGLMKEVEEEKYLGDYISAKGLGDSTLITITKRCKKVTTALMEIRAVVEDCRAHVTGGLVTGLEIWDIAVMPFLLNNSETWAEIPPKALEVLENIQNQFLKSILNTPRTCPTPSLLWETGTITMENKIIKKKLLFFYHLLHLPEESLAWEIAQVQANLSLPGLLMECKSLSKNIDLPEALSCTKIQWKKLVLKRINEKNRNDVLKSIELF